MENGGAASREGGGDAGLEALKGVAVGKALRKPSLGFSPPTLTGPSRVPPPTWPLSLSGIPLPSPLGAVGSWWGKLEGSSAPPFLSTPPAVNCPSPPQGLPHPPAKGLYSPEPP